MLILFVFVFQGDYSLNQIEKPKDLQLAPQLWQMFAFYQEGTVVQHGNSFFVAICYHWAYPDCDPPSASSLWRRMATAEGSTSLNNFIYPKVSEIPWQTKRHRSVMDYVALPGWEPSMAPSLWKMVPD